MRIKKNITIISFIIPFLCTLIFIQGFTLGYNNFVHATEIKIQNPNINVIIDEDDPAMEFIDYILPKDKTTMYESDTRESVSEKPPFEAISLKDVINKGTSVKYSMLYSNKKYSRPVYTPAWRDFYYRGWLYMPTKISEARHKIFMYPLGASSTFDFEGSLNFRENIVCDSHRNINLLIYDFNVKSMKKYDNQIALVGEPSRTGASIISIVQDDLLPKGVNEKLFLIQLSTPEGYEEDFIYGNAVKYDYQKKSIEENSVKTTAPMNGSDSLN
ncbi:hypothetical protein [Clostridium omnivorum]|uniref:Uncharacterized protein n=1 Tax=Clostridium omnivorum TaxID=1604902 RepID=A0ABQ5N0Z1_9CLOT|nr:hypothetical protein [Clostridium sp. E14]GLC28865.1 hypothetical protein bsdE14_02750 [Clostridium sp. E14]